MQSITFLLPIFAIIVTGFVVAHFDLLPESLGEVLIKFAYNIGLPALLFLVIAQESVDRLFNPAFLASYGGATFLFFLAILSLAIWWQRKSVGDAAILALIGACSNTAFVALPILKASFGHRAVLPAAIASVIMISMILVAVVLIEASRSGGQEERHSIWRAVREALLNPIVLAMLFGVANAVAGWKLPAIVVDYLTLLGDSVTPCALFAVGMSIRIGNLKFGAGTVLTLATVKLIVIPALVLVLVNLSAMDPFFAVAAVICAAVPTAKTVFVLASRYDRSKELAAEAVSASTLISTVTLLAWLAILTQFYPAAFPAH